MRRTQGWQKRLTVWLGAAQRARFDPGALDCGLFGAGALQALTGIDLAAPYRGRYRTVRGGLRHLRRDGYADHVALAAAHLRRRVEGERARPGDLAVIDTGDGPALGVVQGTLIYAMAAEGLRLLPLSAAAIAFEVP